MKINQSLLIGGTLIATGLYKTIKDYDEAPIDRKNRTLIRDSIIIGLSAFSILKTDKFLSSKINSEKIQGFASRISSKILNLKIIQKHLPTEYIKAQKLSFLSDVLADCTKGTLSTISGLLIGITTGLLSDKLLSIIKIPEKKEPIKIPHYSPHNKYLNSAEFISKTQLIVSTSAKIFETAGFIQNPFEKPGMLLESVEASKEKNYKKFIEQSAIGIVSEAIVPTIFISLTNSFSRNLTKWVKLPLLGTALIAGEYAGKFVGKYLKHEIHTN